MPSESKAQQRFMGAELARKRAGEATQTGMSEEQLGDFAGTKTKGLPERVPPPKHHKKHSGGGGGRGMIGAGRQPKPRGGSFY